MSSDMWRIETGNSPLVAMAIHAGSSIRDELLDYLVIDASQRKREEDPYTDEWTDVAENRIVVDASRFQVDLNRQRDKAVYLSAEDAWGLDVWTRDLPEQFISASLAEYDKFYRVMGNLFTDLSARHGCFVVFDLHSYNHRRNGPDALPAEMETNPQVNVGTGTMTNRARFAPVIEGFIETLKTAKFPLGPLDVRENIKFKGGQFAKWAHTTFPDSACVLSIEFKKFFMDEWTGKPDIHIINAIHDAFASTVSPVFAALETI
jgi:N-formylglutamate amidohydrolase